MVDRRRRERMYHAALKAVAVTTHASICVCILQVRERSVNILV